MKRNYGSLLLLAGVLALCAGLLTACSPTSAPANEPTATDSAATGETGGMLTLRVNPEIDIHYDAQGKVTAVNGQNPEAQALLQETAGYIGKDCRTVVSELVSAIGTAGYFVEETEGSQRTITIEIEKGSSLPYDGFLDDIASDVRAQVSENQWHSPVALEGTAEYGLPDYVDTDYGPGNDGDSNYAQDTDYGPGNDGITDYNDTDYGPNNDGITDYNDTDYGPNNDGITDYNDTDYGPNNDGITDYNDTDYGPNNDGITDYNDTDYGPGNDGITDYNDTDYGPNNDGITDYGNSQYGDTNYDDGGSNYSDHDDGGSDYDD